MNINTINNLSKNKNTADILNKCNKNKIKVIKKYNSDIIEEYFPKTKVNFYTYSFKNRKDKYITFYIYDKKYSISLLSMKKDKKIRELDEWLSNANDHDFDDDTSKLLKNYEEVQLEADFSYISEIDNTLGDFEYKMNGVQDYILNKLKKKNIPLL